MTEVRIVEHVERVADYEDLVADWKDDLQADGVDITSPEAVARACYEMNPDLFEAIASDYEVYV